jgi:hypothetical protein
MIKRNEIIRTRAKSEKPGNRQGLSAFFIGFGRAIDLLGQARVNRRVGLKWEVVRSDSEAIKQDLDKIGGDFMVVSRDLLHAMVQVYVSSPEKVRLRIKNASTPVISVNLKELDQRSSPTIEVCTYARKHGK